MPGSGGPVWSGKRGGERKRLHHQVQKFPQGGRPESSQEFLI